MRLNRGLQSHFHTTESHSLAYVARLPWRAHQPVIRERHVHGISSGIFIPSQLAGEVGRQFKPSSATVAFPLLIIAIISTAGSVN